MTRTVATTTSSDYEKQNRDNKSDTGTTQLKNNGEVEKCSTDERGDDDDDDPDDEHTLNEVNKFLATAGILESGGVENVRVRCTGA